MSNFKLLDLPGRTAAQLPAQDHRPADGRNFAAGWQGSRE